MEKLTPAEEEIMLVIWKAGEGNIKSFMEQLEEPLPPYTTVASIVKNLEKKGFLSARKFGNNFFYKPAISSSQYRKNFLSSVVKNHFDNSYKELINFFIDQKNLSREELQELFEMINKQDKK